MSDVQIIAQAVCIVGLAWAWVFDRKSKREAAACHENIEFQREHARTGMQAMSSFSAMVDKVVKPPVTPGDEWKSE